MIKASGIPSKEQSKKIIDKLSRDTIDELSDVFKYWNRGHKTGGIRLTQEWCMDAVPAIMDKKVSELDIQEQLIMIIHFLIGDNYSSLKETNDHKITDEEINCIKAASGFMEIFAKTHADMINQLLNKNGKSVQEVELKRIRDLTKKELLLLIANMNWET